MTRTEAIEARAHGEDVEDPTAGEAVEDIADGEELTAPALAAIGCRYEEAKASIVGRAGASSHPSPDTAPPDRDTQQMDLRAVKPPAARGRPRPPRHTASSPRPPEARAGIVTRMRRRLATRRPASSATEQVASVG